MADNKPSSQNYQNLGGVNKKTSEYNLNKTEFEDLRNVDFFVPNALTKRPGSTSILSAGASTKINSLWEHQFLSGTNIVLAQANGFINELTGSTLTTVFDGFSSNVAADMISFVNSPFVANGSTYLYLEETDTVLPMPPNGASFNAYYFNTEGTATGSIIGTTVGLNYYIAAAYFRPLNGLTTNIGDNTSNFNGIFGAPCTPSSLYDTVYIDGITYTVRNTVGWQYNLTNEKNGYSYMAIFFAKNSEIEVTSLGFTVAVEPDLTAFYYFTLFPIPSGNTFYTFSGSAMIRAANGIRTPSSTNRPAKPLADVSPYLLPNYQNWSLSLMPRFLEVNNNRMLMAGFSGSPSSVLPSELIQPWYASLENIFEVRTNDGDIITGLKTYNGETLIFKRKSFYRLVGDAPSNYSVTEISLEFGCLNNQTIVEFRERLVWLDRQGIVLYNGSSYEVISTAVEPIFRRMNFTAAETEACAEHFPLRNQVWFGIPIDGSSVNNITVVYDYVVQAWTFFDGFNPASFKYIQNVGDPKLIMGDYSGFIKSYSESLFNDSGQAITAKILTRFESNNGEESTNIYRRFFLNVQPQTAITQAINVKAFSDYDSNTVRATFQMFQSTFQSRAEIGVVGKSVQFEISHVSASLPLEVDGFAIARRYLRNV